MTVDSAQNVTGQIWAQSVGQVNLPVGPGDVISGALCLDTKPPCTAHYVLANQTRSQTMNFNIDTGFPPPVTIDAGVTRGGFDQPIHPLARFGVVYFDEISAYTTSGSRSLTWAMPSRWSTKTAPPSPGPSCSTTTPSRPCMQRPDRPGRATDPRPAEGTTARVSRRRLQMVSLH